MAELDTLIRRYLDRGWPLLPLEWRRTARNFKQPLVENGSLDATRDIRLLEEWFLRKWPAAIVGIRTGAAPAGAGIVVLDVDCGPGKVGAETMRALGFGDPPRVPMVITVSGGRHLYFQCPSPLGFGNTQGSKGRGIGKDVDWRGNGGYVCAPGGLQRLYRWHSRCNLDSCRILLVPPELLPREPPPEPAPGADRCPAAQLHHADAYVNAMMERACREIAEASDGEQNTVLNGTSFNIGNTAGHRNLVAAPLINAMVAAGMRMRNFRPNDPWRRDDIERKVRAGFEAGLAKARR
jgi:hypothetical protein